MAEGGPSGLIDGALGRPVRERRPRYEVTPLSGFFQPRPTVRRKRDTGFHRQVSVATGPKFVFMAGQVSWNADGALVGKDDLGAQVEQAYLNVATALSGVGGTFDNVAKLTVYVVDWTPHGDRLRPAPVPGCNGSRRPSIHVRSTPKHRATGVVTILADIGIAATGLSGSCARL